MAVLALVFVVALAGLAILRERSAPDYQLSEAQAIAAAKQDPQVDRFVAEAGYTRAESIPLDKTLRRVTFFDGPRVVLDAAVDPQGRVRYSQEHRPGVQESGSKVANSPWVLTLFTCLFLLATAVTPLRRLRNLDALALASFGIVIVLINERLVVPSAAVAVVPLIYLIARCVQVGTGRAARSGPSVPLYDWLTRSSDPVSRWRVLAMVTGGAAISFLTMTLTSAGESDVATASLAGATQLVHGELPYGHMVENLVHGDTYPLLTYVFYVPGALLTPVVDFFSDRTGALAVTAAAAMVAAAGFFRLAAVQARTSPAGGADELPRLAGLRGVLAWLSFPPVLLAASGGSNDIVLAACLVWVLATTATTGRSTLLLSVAAWVKVVPLVLLPLWLARLRGAALARGVGLGLALSAVLCLWLVLLGGIGAIGEMLEGLSFQLQRGSFHAPWRPFGLEWLQLVVQAALVAALVWVTLRERREPGLLDDPVRLAATLGALLLSVQLAANYWTWAYLPWAFPFVAVALLAGTPGGRAAHAANQTT